MELISCMTGDFMLEWYKLDSEFPIEDISSLPSGNIILYSRWDFDEMGLNTMPRVLLGRE